MTAESIIQEIKQALNGRPGQPIVLGVCRALSVRFRQEAWIVRLAFIIVGLFWALPALAAYIVLGFMLPETERRTGDFFSGLGILIRETLDKAFTALGGLFGSSGRRGSRSGGY